MNERPNFKNELTVEYVAVARVTAAARRTRRHSLHKIKKLAAAIADTGVVTPILLDQKHQIIAGHARVAAAKRLGMETVPAIIIRGLSEPQKRRLALADNKLAEEASWDTEMLALELQELLEMDPANIEYAGFDIPDLDNIITPRPVLLDDEQDDLPEPPVAPTSRLGDRWQCGKHAVICGDARTPEAYSALLGWAKADAVFADPPYGLSAAKDINGRGKVKHGDFVMASGEMSSERLAEFFEASLIQVKAYTRDGAVVFVCIDWRHVAMLVTVAERLFTKLLNIACWVLAP